MDKLLYDIKPLSKRKTGKRGKPSQWHKALYLDYRKYRADGVDHDLLLRLWQVEEPTMRNWCANDLKLAQEIENWQKNQPKKTESKTVYNKETLQGMAIKLLQDLIVNMSARPEGYKPTEIITACREALDRTEGKAAMTIEHKASGSFAINVLTAPDYITPAIAECIDIEAYEEA